MRKRVSFTDIDELDITPGIRDVGISFKANINAADAIKLVIMNQKGMLVETVELNFVTDDEPELITESKLLISEAS